MKRKTAIFLVLFTVVGFASAKPKRPSLPEVFETAKSVHIETSDARDITDISLDPKIRNTILNLQDEIQIWGRYSLSRSRRDADLILVIYKGRLLGINRGLNGTPPDAFNRERDELEVYTLGPNGKLKDIVWRRDIERGLDAPSLPLLRQLELEIDKAYPHQSATSSDP